MTWALTIHTSRECFRKPFAYVLVAAVVMVSFASQLLHVFSFGAGAEEATNLAISAVFLAGVANAAFVGTTLIRGDLERGTLALLLSQPVGLASYVIGRFLGLGIYSLVVCALTAGGAAGALALAGPPDGALGTPFLLACARVGAAALVLDAAALAFSGIATRVFAPALVLALFLAGDVAESSAWGRVLPSFGAFAFEAGRTPSWGWLLLYAALYCGVFLLVAYILLTLKSPIRAET